MLALLYDVHGNLPALEAVLADASADRYLLGSDYAVGGAWPVETVDRLRELEPATWIRGNTERWLVDRSDAPEPIHPLIDVCRDALGDANIEELVALPESFAEDDVLYCHGSPRSDMDSFLPEPRDEDAELLMGVEARRVVFGHTHLAFERTGPANIHLVNPGSVGMPWDGDHRAGVRARARRRRRGAASGGVRLARVGPGRSRARRRASGPPSRRGTLRRLATRGSGSLAGVRLSNVIAPKDRQFFDLFEEAGGNIVRAAGLLEEMLLEYPERSDLAREILICEQDGDRITHDIIQRLNQTFVTPIDREDIHELSSALDDVVDYTEEVADYLGLYKIEAPMTQAQDLAKVLHAAARQIAEAMPRLRGFKDISHYTVEINRLENDGDRITREAIASLFDTGIDPMVVIRWKDIFERLEDAIDSTEHVANILEGIVIKNS